MAKIAVELERALKQRAESGAPGGTLTRVLAVGDGWKVADVVCTSGPRDRPFEERHAQVDVAVVAAGSFEYRSANGRHLMTPGSLLLGNAEQGFTCAHDHGVGDRCVAFQFAPDYFERVAADAGASPRFRIGRLPPRRELSRHVARALAGLAGRSVAWEELGVRLAAAAARVLADLAPDRSAPAPSAVARVARSVREIEERPDADLTLQALAREAGLSPYHFLRTFESVSGVTPHQYVLRARLRRAALQLELQPSRVTDVALDCGFGDVSNFNRSFRAEFGVTPRGYRAESAS